MMRFFSALLAAAAFVAGTAAHAHKPSDSYLTLHVADSAVQGQWDIALRDLELAVGVDSDGNGAITWGELRSRRREVFQYALSHLALRTASGACALEPGEELVDEHTDGTYAVLRFSANCPSGASSLSMTYSLLFDVDPQHRGLARIVGMDGVRSAIFSSDERTREFRAGSPDRWHQFTAFVADGIKHIAIGTDHILFLVALLLPAVMVREGRTWQPASSLGTTMRNVLGIVTAFTLAHSITLSLAALRIVQLPSRLVESLIALSVVLTAIDNLVPFLPRKRWRVAFAFGLLHGLGFASVLLDLGLPPDALAVSLFGFNVGVEIGQLALVVLLLPLTYALRGQPAYPRLAVGAGSALIACVALGWVVERALSLPFMPF